MYLMDDAASVALAVTSTPSTTMVLPVASTPEAGAGSLRLSVIGSWLFFVAPPSTGDVATSLTGTVSTMSLSVVCYCRPAQSCATIGTFEVPSGSVIVALKLPFWIVAFWPFTETVAVPSEVTWPVIVTVLDASSEPAAGDRLLTAGRSPLSVTVMAFAAGVSDVVPSSTAPTVRPSSTCRPPGIRCSCRRRSIRWCWSSG